MTMLAGGLTSLVAKAPDGGWEVYSGPVVADDQALGLDPCEVIAWAVIVRVKPDVDAVTALAEAMFVVPLEAEPHEIGSSIFDNGDAMEFWTFIEW